jgi:hypothetical protein
VPRLKVFSRIGKFLPTGSRRLELEKTLSPNDVFNERNALYDAKVVGDYTGLSLRKGKLSS